MPASKLQWIVVPALFAETYKQMRKQQQSLWAARDNVPME